ncbi:DNA cytosine methyltransferase [Shewanella sp.]|uniref:DNA cytosine methyltransferase n=1 Tax=Shewanella sp. TaxID=50422 RepID=UPI0040486AA6
MNELALFAGAGGGILGGKLLGWRTVCAVEWEPYPASVLCARQNDGLLPPFPIWDDVQTFDGKPWRGIVEVISGGFPCQDISAAGKGAGIDGERSGMWREMARIIYEVRPRYAFVENSPMLTSRGLGIVLGDLATMGFDARWGVLGAADVGANHKRDRIWIVAKWRGQLSHAQHNRIGRWEQQQKGFEEAPRNMAYTRRELRQTREPARLDTDAQVGSTRAIHNQPSGEGQASLADTPGVHAQRQHSRPWEIQFGRKSWWETEPNVGRVANGLAAGVDRLKAIGNGQVPLCAATAWQILSKDI